MGRAAVRYALKGYTDCMVTLVRQSDAKYECDTGLAPLDDIAGNVKVLPQEYLDTSSGFLTQAFVDYVRPLVGGPMPRYERLTTVGL